MPKGLLAAWFAVALIWCASALSSPPELEIPGATAVGQSEDSTYGYTKENPVKVGGSDLRDGPKRERAYLNSLRGPSGQRVKYQRLGSCCHFETPNGLMGGGLLDMYELTYDGLTKSVTIYINFYDPGSPLAPVGFTVGKQ